MQYTLTNGVIERIFEVSEHGVRTVSLKDLQQGTEYIHTPVREYAFAIDDVLFSSYGESRVREVDGNREDVDLLPVLTEARQDPGSLELEFEQGPVRVTLCYRIYPGLCGTRKHLVIRNRSGKEVRLSNVVFDDTCAAPGDFSSCDFTRAATTGRSPSASRWKAPRIRSAVMIPNGMQAGSWGPPHQGSSATS